jgi:hypothetical protein
LNVGLKICTSRLNIEVAANVAPTLITLVVAAADKISAFGTGILTLVPGTTTSVTSAAFNGSGTVGIDDSTRRTDGAACAWRSASFTSCCRFC